MADLVKQDYYRFPSVSKLKPEDFDNVQSLLTSSIYLQDWEVTVKGSRIYGAPWTPWFNGWGFNLPRGQSLLEKWNLIPEGTDSHDTWTSSRFSRLRSRSFKGWAVWSC
jgi:hypothetical protein